jgi:hypothetical protein
MPAHANRSPEADEVEYQRTIRQQGPRHPDTGMGLSPAEGLDEFVIEPARRRARIAAEKAASFGKGPVDRST